MAIEFFSGNCGDTVMSPRISFSCDFCHSNAIPVEQNLPRSNSSVFNNPSFDFDFCVRENFDHESSSADELFSDGRLLPSEIKKNKNKKMMNFPQNHTDHIQFLKSIPTETVRENASTTKISKPDRLKEEAYVDKHGQNHKSFWRFKRSNSYGNGGYGRSLCPLPLLSRSYSTGSTSPSTSSVKKNTSVSKEGKNNNNAQECHASRSSSMGYNSYLKSPLKKSQISYGTGGIPVILNVPSANLFGFGSIFSKSKDKTKRKY